VYLPDVAPELEELFADRLPFLAFKQPRASFELQYWALDSLKD
jgi:hypothetical protein